MAKVLCEIETKKIVGFHREGDFTLKAGQVEVDAATAPDFKKQRLNDTDDGIIDKSQAELDAEAVAEKDAKAPELLEPKKAHAAVIEVVHDSIAQALQAILGTVYDNSAELQTAFPIKQDFIDDGMSNLPSKQTMKQTAVTVYRGKL